MAEASLRHIQKMDVVGQLTGGIAHDFNNLLAVITGNIELILRKPADSDRVTRIAKAAFQAAERGERLIEQLLMFSRRQVMRPVTLNLNRVLLEFETLMRHAAGPQIDLRLKLDPGLDPSNVDRAQFEAAILNLVVNARDALPKGGRIIIETINVVIEEADPERNSDLAPGAYAMVAVSDNGLGIEPSVLSHVFEPFFTTKEVGQGTGLGLSISRRLVELMGGETAVESVEGAGSLFWFTAHFATVVHSLQPHYPVPASLKGRRVLMVDDNATNLAILERYARSWNMQPACASNGVGTTSPMA